MNLRDTYSVIPESYRKKGVLISLSLFLRAVLDFAGVAVFIPVLARVLEKGEDFMSVLPVAGAALAFIVVKSVAVAGLTRYRSGFVFSLYSTLSETVLKKFMDRGLLFIRQSSSVDLSNKVNAVTMTFVSGVILSLLNVISSVMLLAIILIALFIYEPLPTLALILVIGPFLFFYSFFVRKRVRALGIMENQARKDQVRAVLDLFRGYPEYYVNDALGHQTGIFEDSISKIREVRMKTESYSAVSSGFMEITVMLSVILLVLLSVSGSWGISMTFGIFALSAMKILPSVRSIVSGWQAVQASEYSTGVLKEILDGPTVMVQSPAEPLSFRHGISLRSISFRYDASRPCVFHDFSLEIRKGEYVGIKGRSGAGKTTLFNLLMGFYRPEKGGLYVDDTEITAGRVSSWQSMIGYVPQDVFLTNGTFVENVAFGRSSEDADRDRIRHIFRKVGLWDWISGLPQGMDTLLAEAGNTISGGQKQRIGIARALYKGASVLFFDEATSSVDMKSESEINSFIRELAEEDTALTVIVIAHRPETLASCTRIIDLDGMLEKDKLDLDSTKSPGRIIR